MKIKCHLHSSAANVRALEHAVADAVKKVAGERGLWRQPAAQAQAERRGARY